MAGCVIDEAVRNCVAVGADPDRIALLDNFCWGNTERPETLGSLVLAAQGCHDLALAYGTPFISGKDSLNNEYTHDGQSLAIPPTLLISAMGQVPDVRTCVTMDLKEPGNLALARRPDPRSSWAARTGLMVRGRDGGSVPRVDPELGRGPLPGGPRGDHARPGPGLPRPERRAAWPSPWPRWRWPAAWAPTSRSRDVPCDDDAAHDAALLFSESPTRFLLEVRPEHVRALCRPLRRPAARPARRGDRDGAAGAPRSTVPGSTASP